MYKPKRKKSCCINPSIPAVLNLWAVTVTNTAPSLPLCRYTQLQDLNVDHMVLSFYLTAITLFCPKQFRMAANLTTVEVTLHAWISFVFILWRSYAESVVSECPLTLYLIARDSLTGTYYSQDEWDTVKKSMWAGKEGWVRFSDTVYCLQSSSRTKHERRL